GTQPSAEALTVRPSSEIHRGPSCPYPAAISSADPGGRGGSGKGAQSHRGSAPLCYGITTLICEAAFPPTTPRTWERFPGQRFFSLGAFLCRSGPSGRVDLYAS